MLATCLRRQRPRYSTLEPQTMVNKAPPFRVYLKGYPFKGPFRNQIAIFAFLLLIYLFVYLFSIFLPFRLIDAT